MTRDSTAAAPVYSMDSKALTRARSLSGIYRCTAAWRMVALLVPKNPHRPRLASIRGYGSQSSSMSMASYTMYTRKAKPYRFFSGISIRYCTKPPTVRPRNSATENREYMAAVMPGNVRKNATRMGEYPLPTPLVTAM